MNGKWIEVFRSGTHTDANGKKISFTQSDLESIAKNYNENEHTAPVVVGHPKDNHPAYGWVEKLKAEGGKLKAKLKEVIPEFSEAVKKGLYKKRSISLYPDMRLRHLGFLGAKPPAVKGLEDIAFSEESQTLCFEENFETEETMEEVEKLKKQLEEKDEALKKMQEHLNSISSALEGEKKNKQEKEIEEFCEALSGEGRLTPAQKDDAVKVLQSIEMGVTEFGEGQSDPSSAFKSLLQSLPVQVDFGEKATKKSAADKKKTKEAEFGEYDPERMEVHEKAVELSQKESIDYAEAVEKIIKGV